jgi:SHS2 domain-containing protein
MEDNHFKFEILSHTADLRIKAMGKDTKELFSNMLKGLSSVMVGEVKDNEFKKKKITVKSQDIKALLVDFLNEVLYQSYIEKEIYTDVNFKKFSDQQIDAELIGRSVKRFNEDVKAATYHNLEFSKNEKGLFEATVIFDI